MTGALIMTALLYRLQATGARYGIELIGMPILVDRLQRVGRGEPAVGAPTLLLLLPSRAAERR